MKGIRRALIAVAVAAACGAALCCSRLVLSKRAPARRRSGASVCSMLKRLLPRGGADRVIEGLIDSSPTPRALVLDVGLAHGRECIAIARRGHVCRGYEADPQSAR
eukprot:6754857-Prymnesium_polylepis.1